MDHSGSSPNNSQSWQGSNPAIIVLEFGRLLLRLQTDGAGQSANGFLAIKGNERPSFHRAPPLARRHCFSEMPLTDFGSRENGLISYFMDLAPGWGAVCACAD